MTALLLPILLATADLSLPSDELARDIATIWRVVPTSSEQAGVVNDIIRLHQPRGTECVASAPEKSSASGEVPPCVERPRSFDAAALLEGLAALRPEFDGSNSNDAFDGVVIDVLMREARVPPDEEIDPPEPPALRAAAVAHAARGNRHPLELLDAIQHDRRQATCASQQFLARQRLRVLKVDPTAAETDEPLDYRFESAPSLRAIGKGAQRGNVIVWKDGEAQVERDTCKAQRRPYRGVAATGPTVAFERQAALKLALDDFQADIMWGQRVRIDRAATDAEVVLLLHRLIADAATDPGFSTEPLAAFVGDVVAAYAKVKLSSRMSSADVDAVLRAADTLERAGARDLKRHLKKRGVTAANIACNQENVMVADLGEYLHRAHRELARGAKRPTIKAVEAHVTNARHARREQLAALHTDERSAVAPHDAGGFAGTGSAVTMPAPDTFDVKTKTRRWRVPTFTNTPPPPPVKPLCTSLGWAPPLGG
jgi:hypothetical protein